MPTLKLKNTFLAEDLLSLMGTTDLPREPVTTLSQHFPERALGPTRAGARYSDFVLISVVSCWKHLCSERLPEWMRPRRLEAIAGLSATRPGVQRQHKSNRPGKAAKRSSHVTCRASLRCEAEIVTFLVASSDYVRPFHFVTLLVPGRLLFGECSSRTRMHAFPSKMS